MVQGVLLHPAEGTFARTLAVETPVTSWTATDHPVQEV